MIKEVREFCLVLLRYWRRRSLASQDAVASNTAKVLLVLCICMGMFLFITVQLHVMQCAVLPRPFCLSVHLSAVTKWKSCAYNLVLLERSFILVFWQEEWLEGATPCTWNFGPNWTSYIGHKTDPQLHGLFGTAKLLAIIVTDELCNLFSLLRTFL